MEVLTKHLADIGGQLGAHNEGIGYTEYPMSFAIPAAMALADHGHQAPLKAAREHAFWKLNLYAQTFMTSYQRKCIQYGVGHAGNHNEGFASLAMGLCPPESLPYYVWFYDHHMGRLAKARDRYRFDGDRGSTPMSLLFYPPDVEPKDPTGVLPKTAMDGDGYIFFRNRWKDENDVQVALLASAKRSGGWSQDEHLNLRLMAFDTHFFGGPGKERGPENYTTLLVDGHNAPPSKKDFQAGEIVAFEPGEAGGYAIVAGGGHYRSLGVTGARRHLLVHFAPPADGSAILATLDDVTSESEHTYTWQANLGPEGVTMPRQPAEQGPKETGRQLPGLGDVPDAADDLGLPEMLEEKPEAQHKPKPEPLKPIPNDDGIDSTTGSESDRPTFLLEGRNNAFVKGWVVHPADATVKSGDPLQLNTKGTSAKIWVVLYVGQGKAPAAVIDGEGMSSVVKVAGRTVRWDAAKSRVVCE